MTESIVTLIAVTTALLGSPGPAPLALAATGAVFGVRAGVPFLIGVLLGLGVALLATFLGLSALLSSYPEAKLALQIVGGLYICFIAYKIASAPVGNGLQTLDSAAPSFTDGFILNLLNPKVYAAFLAIFSQFLIPASSTAVSYLITGSLCFMVAVVVDVLWLALGGLIGPLFQNPNQARALRIVFALIMILAVMWAMLQGS